MSQADHRRRFESVVVEVVEPVRRYLWRRAEPDAAEDVLSETLLVLWRRVEDIPVDAVPWSIGVARLQLANDERSRRRQHRLINRIATVDPPREIATEAGNPVDDAVRNTIAQLRPQDAEVLRLWAWEELELREIAHVLGVSVNAATVRLHRAKQRFSDRWSKTHGGIGHVDVTERSPQ